ncbi:MAG: hypothetical protein HKL95_11785 [Phycisphaerae bacterium]|nr:hypothetical protein [Phycisphaerae bacterium]
MFTYNRDGLELNGKWKFCPDPMQRCRRQKWWKGRPGPDDIFPSWDPEGLWDIQVPGTWKTQFEQLRWYDGHAVYMKDFTLPEVPPDREAFLCFDGIVYSGEIYLNGQLLGRHDWGYSPFQLQATQVLSRQNRLFVLVENVLRPDRVPGEIFDWNNDGGMINPVKLIFVPSVYIRNFRTETVLAGDQAHISVDVELDSRNPSAQEEVVVRVLELGLSGRAVVQAGRTGQVTFTIARSKITLWSPDSPKLYRTEVATRHETIADEIGYREIKTDGGEVVLNGEAIRLYGVCTHAEFPRTGRTATHDGIQEIIKNTRELGANFLRCAHYPYPEVWGRALDRAGILWWQEVPAYWLFNMREPDQTRLACGMLEETIRRDFNRAGLIIWSVSNECCYRNPENPAENNYPYWFKAVEMVRRVDPSRLVTCAEAGNMVATEPTWQPEAGDGFNRPAESIRKWRPMHTDEFYKLFDILAANLYVRQPGEAAEAYGRLVTLFSPYGKPLMVSEFGHVSLLKAQVPPAQVGSPVRHAQMLAEAYAAFAELPQIVGYAPWILADVRSPIQWRWYNQGKAIKRHGLIDENGRRKAAFEAVRQGIAALKRQFTAKSNGTALTDEVMVKALTQVVLTDETTTGRSQPPVAILQGERIIGG